MIEVEGKKYKVTDKGCYSHDFGAYWKCVATPDGEKIVVGGRGSWRFWTAFDRTRPLREAMEKGWTPENGWPKEEPSPCQEDDGSHAKASAIIEGEL